MSNHPINGLMDTTLEKIKQMVDVNTIIGNPITSPDGTVIIPVSKVSYGFASGGSDIRPKTANGQTAFGGGSGAGVTIKPVGFLSIYKGDVKFISVDKYDGPVYRIVGMVPEMFDKVKEAGFNAVRIPVSWSTHVSNNGQYQFAIDGQWMARVKEVVNYAYDNGMFVIINIHHDNDQWHMFPSNQYLNQSKKYVTDIWTQVAKEFADYDQHLIFETINEPRVVGDPNEWYFDPSNPTASVSEAIGCINQINQAAVDAIRNAGGNNMDRLVGCPGYVGSIDGVTTNNF